jgi:hypothetical protein
MKIYHPENELGKLQRIYKPSSSIFILLFLGFLFCVCSFTSLLFFDLSALFYTIPLFIGGVILCIYALVNIRLKIIVYDNGVTFKRASRIDRYVWSDIVSLDGGGTKHILNLIPVGTMYKFTILFKDQNRIKLTQNIDHVNLLVASIKQHINC